MTYMKTITRLTLIAAVVAVGANAQAAGGKTKHLKEKEWHFSGPLGKYDQEALQRGFQVYEAVCSNCHALDYTYFRNLGQKGGPFYLDLSLIHI